jgi:short-subunit dehydrogenase
MFGLVGMPKLAAYSTTKFAMVGFSEVLRNECGRDGLGVTALCPGFVDTNLFTSAPLGDKQTEHKIPPRIFQTTPEKVANAAVKAIRRNRRLVVMTPAAWFLVSVKRFVPGVMDIMFRIGRRKRVTRKIAKLKSAA